MRLGHIFIASQWFSADTWSCARSLPLAIKMNVDRCYIPQIIVPYEYINCPKEIGNEVSTLKF